MIQVDSSPLSESSAVQSDISTSEIEWTVDRAIANLCHEDTSLRYYAAWWLGKFRVQESAAVDALIAALADEDDRTQLGGYPLRRNAARALGKIGNRRAVPALVQCLSCPDFYVREAAAQALGVLGDPVCIPDLIQLIQDRDQATQPVPGQPHLAQPCEAILEALGYLHAIDAVEQIRLFLNHPLPKIDYAATRSLYQLTGESIYGEKLVQALQGNDVQLRRSALADLGAIGYLPSAEAIAQAPVENSFKLFALKGLLAHSIAVLPRAGGTLPDRSIQIMALMDSLL